MYFNDTATKQGICQEIDDLCDSTPESYPIESKTRRANTALLELELLALMADGRWQFDDKNYASNPTGLITLQNGVQEYDYDSTLLFLEAIEVLLPDGVTWQRLNPIDELKMRGTSIQNYLSVTGLPSEYYLKGNKIGLTPIPTTGNVTLVGGMKTTFKRRGSLFVPSDTTKEAGIEQTFHILIAQKAALPYCKTYKKDRVPQLVIDIANGEKNYKGYYASRHKDPLARNQMTMKKFSFR